MNVNSLTRFPATPDAWRVALDFVEDAQHAGHRIHPMFMVNIKGIHIALESTFVLDEMLSFRRVLTLPFDERVVVLRDPATATTASWNRRPHRARADLHLAEVKIASASDPAHHDWIGRSVGDLAAARRRRRARLAHRCRGSPKVSRPCSSGSANLHPLITETTHAIIRHPLTMAGSSDGGAHLQTFCGADYTTRLFTDMVPDVLSFEQAVSRLTMQPACCTVCGIGACCGPARAWTSTCSIPMNSASNPSVSCATSPPVWSRLIFGATRLSPDDRQRRTADGRGEHTGALPGRTLRFNGA